VSRPSGKTSERFKSPFSDYETQAGTEGKDIQKNSMVLVPKRTVPIERSPLVSEDSANFSG
jgi:hypothetical protein